MLAIIFAVCGALGGLLLTPVRAPVNASVYAAADTTVGGARLSGHGYIGDKRSGAPEPPHIEASSYVIADLETGAVLAAKDPHGHYRPASTLKTLTAITLIPRLDPHKKVRPSLNAVNASGSAVGLSTNMDYTVSDLFHGLLMQSGNDAAIALAETNGGMATTLATMNAEAHRIRASDTVARTPNGLDDDPPLTLHQQHSSAYDMALIMKQGLTLPDFRKYVGARLYHWPAPPTKEERTKGKKTGGYEIGTHDHLLFGYPGMIGGKNGWTSHALGSFVGAAKRHGHTIIIALMRAQSDFWPDARTLLDWGFAERDKVQPVGTLVDPIPPPAPPKAKAVAAKPASGARTVSSDGFGWWEAGLPAGAGAAIIAGVAVGLRRRRRPAPEGASPAADGVTPPGSYGAGGEASRQDGDPAGGGEPGPRRLPPGDVKVAGAPPAPGERGRPPSWETVPNAAHEPAAQPPAQPPAEPPTEPAADEPEDAPRTWTVRLPQEDLTAGRSPVEPGDRTGDDPGDEPERS